MPGGATAPEVSLPPSDTPWTPSLNMVHSSASARGTSTDARSHYSYCPALLVLSTQNQVLHQFFQMEIRPISCAPLTCALLN
ncbi:hypothetical protein GDO81_017561 [Engystomops pustulosus]|uniref:Uncharacterized protein n=1 Tax=Engystomops pustulosus TaxID=76066 RepID=A0AAV7A492_ENGPU|nr:hypothetical protein GDO81_017561 [Engystomops pustulosus]